MDGSLVGVRYRVTYAANLFGYMGIVADPAKNLVTNL